MSEPNHNPCHTPTTSPCFAIYLLPLIYSTPCLILRNPESLVG